MTEVAAVLLVAMALWFAGGALYILFIGGAAARRGRHR